jgi:predicted nucleic acid-binding protein
LILSKSIVIFDACVLYPAPLRDLLMHLAGTNLFRARWTDEIHDEWTRNLLKNRTDLTKERLQRTRDFMNKSVRDCLVTGYQDLIPSLSLPDKDDRHVLAAAIYAAANIIVTFNLKDFPDTNLNEYGMKAQHPDDFIVNLIEINHISVCEAARQQRLLLKNPPKSIEESLATYEKQGLVQTVVKLKLYDELL